MITPFVLTPELMAETEHGRPEWAKRKRSIRVWCEDEATLGIKDHEDLYLAWKRLVPYDNLPTMIAYWNSGDAIYRLYSDGYIQIESFPGTSSIRKLKMEGQP